MGVFTSFALVSWKNLCGMYIPPSFSLCTCLGVRDKFNVVVVLVKYAVGVKAFQGMPTSMFSDEKALAFSALPKVQQGLSCHERVLGLPLLHSDKMIVWVKSS